MNTEQTERKEKAEKHFAAVDDLANKMCQGLNGFEIGVCLDALSFAAAMIMAETGDVDLVDTAMKDFSFKTTNAARLLILKRSIQ